MNPFPFRFNNLLFNCYHLFWQNNSPVHGISFSPLRFSFDVFATMNSFLSDNMRCRMGDENDHCEHEPSVTSIPTFFCVLYHRKNWASVKSQQISAFSPVPLGMKTPLYLSYTMPLAENESLHCNFMLPRCRAPFWRAHVMFVGTWIMIASTLRTANLYTVSSRVKAMDREALHVKDPPNILVGVVVILFFLHYIPPV